MPHRGRFDSVQILSEQEGRVSGPEITLNICVALEITAVPDFHLEPPLPIC